MEKPHILLVTFPSQGHINPGLQFAKRLTKIGVKVTFSTSVSAHRRMTKNTTTESLISYAPFSDGYDEGFKSGVDDLNHFMMSMRRFGSQNLKAIISEKINQGPPFTSIVYSILIPWVGKLARELHIPSTHLWNQPATLFDIYYDYFRGYGDVITDHISDPSYVVNLPHLPPLATRDLPSFFSPSNQYSFALTLFKEQFEILDEETNPKVLVNTFDALEAEPLSAVDKYKLVGVGPLIPSAFLDGKDPSDTSFGGDLFKGSKDYIEWLNTKPEASVIYVSFGSISVLSRTQMEEMGRALLDTGRPFLWVIREGGVDGQEKEKDKLSCKEELEKQGMIVPWCTQVEVLSHPSVGCFVTHCGWNSTSESLASGVPVVACPQWTDQTTNAKLIADVWKTGVRLIRNEEGIAKAPEMKRCLEVAMENEELRRNAKKWKDLAREAAKEGGSSYKNIKEFVDEVNGTVLSHH
ncbi:UDPGT domain-containing protein [Cephalotus follicularis]|uniref:Glycosyltransferase n=1 Tax=Cephalotus follicularis TaxID=3775 RepID=A0A1Q3BPF3_CEPFO|nr:UDPGT domain-containing protein [Cephalotus follicularis]